MAMLVLMSSRNLGVEEAHVTLEKLGPNTSGAGYAARWLGDHANDRDLG
jgi:hypothetical protein